MTNEQGVKTAAADTSDDEMAALRAIVEGTAEATGDEFFRALVRNLAIAIDVQYAFIAEFTDVKSRVRTQAYWARGEFADNVEYDLEGTPCQDVVGGGLCHHPFGICTLFPEDHALVEMGIESYLGVPLTDNNGDVLGHLAVFDQRPMPEEPRRLYIFKIFAARAAAELRRLRMEQALRDSELRFRDLFEEAPIAYVYEDTETRFVRVNRAAMNLLGLKPGDVPGTVGMSLVAPDQSTQERISEAFADIQQGKERSLPELELRRKDDGRPVWVQFWSRPEPGGNLTRTMILDITDRVLAERERARLQRESLYLQEEIKAANNFEEIIGRSPALAAVLEHVRAVAPTDASVLIHGETGTGKELIARAVHSSGKRKDQPLIKVNCAALPAGLVESELFGHEKGAFTGAIARRIGRFELADGGTIFLDEIGELPLEIQAKLLRVLQERELDRIGGRAPIRVDVRVIAATNRDLAAAVREKEFREDLYYRLNVFPIQLPPLRERAGDVPLLAYYFAARFAAQLGKPMDGIAPTTLEQLVAYPWPGNIRELENVIERAVILCRGSTLEIYPRILQGSLPSRGTTLGTALPVADGPAGAGADTLEAIER
ncbi:MAG: sigma-54 interaction domain-containing protein, partial [Planctomycetaceae bacterium]